MISSLVGKILTCMPTAAADVAIAVDTAITADHLLHLTARPHLKWDFFSWLIDQSSSIGLRFFQREWRQRPPGYPTHVVGAEIKFQDHLFYGLGHAQNPIQAYIIAGAEALERVGMQHLRLQNSNGCAVHLDVETARQKARYELVERDAFLCHFHTMQPLLPYPRQLDGRIQEMSEFIGKWGWELRVGALHNVENRPALAVAIRGRQAQPEQGLLLGLGLHDNWEGALESGLVECLRYWDAHLVDPSLHPPLPLAEFEVRTKKSVKEHACLGLDPLYAQGVWERLFNGSPGELTLPPSINFSYQEFSLSEIWPECPLWFSQASSPELAQIHFGDNWEKTWNEARWQSFTKASSRWKHPHILG